MPGVTIPYEAFPGSIGVLPGLKEVESWKKREADLAAAGGVVLTPDPGFASARPPAGYPAGHHAHSGGSQTSAREAGGAGAS